MRYPNCLATLKGPERILTYWSDLIGTYVGKGKSNSSFQYQFIRCRIWWCACVKRRPPLVPKASSSLVLTGQKAHSKLQYILCGKGSVHRGMETRTAKGGKAFLELGSLMVQAPEHLCLVSFLLNANLSWYSRTTSPLPWDLSRHPPSQTSSCFCHYSHIVRQQCTRLHVCLSVSFFGTFFFVLSLLFLLECLAPT